MTWLKKLLGMHLCAPGVPHRDENGQMVSTCYGCSKDRPVVADIDAYVRAMPER
jgi:hypothetical protein